VETVQLRGELEIGQPRSQLDLIGHGQPAGVQVQRRQPCGDVGQPPVRVVDVADRRIGVAVRALRQPDDSRRVPAVAQFGQRIDDLSHLSGPVRGLVVADDVVVRAEDRVDTTAPPRQLRAVTSSSPRLCEEPFPQPPVLIGRLHDQGGQLVPVETVDELREQRVRIGPGLVQLVGLWRFQRVRRQGCRYV